MDADLNITSGSVKSFGFCFNDGKNKTKRFLLTAGPYSSCVQFRTANGESLKKGLSNE
tara:strand:+ start:995 stop:1168 length:174 start_codon:yes stop_codon:yes gene_type:complete